jgi:hypothetical protein
VANPYLKCVVCGKRKKYSPHGIRVNHFYLYKKIMLDVGFSTAFLLCDDCGTFILETMADSLKPMLN